MATCGIAFGAIDLKLDRHMSGTRTQLLVLGTMHLENMPKEFTPAALDPVLDKLAAFKPQIITIEALPGESCDTAARNPAIYGPDFCASTDTARRATGLDIPAALAEMTKTLAAWPAQPTPAQRRRLAAVFLAASDPASAYVQWLQLPEPERKAGDGLDDALVERLGKEASRNNENIQIAARLAARLGLPRVYPVDDHSGDNLDISDAKAFDTAMRAAWDAGKPRQDPILAKEDRLAREPNLLPLYRLLNDPASLRVAAEVNVDLAMRSTSPDHIPQIWVGGWETRNLRMIANIRATFREHPGARVLSIVGATHKPWFDGWLGQMQGVDIVDTEAVLK